MIVRTKVFDEMIVDRIRNGGVDQVVNLAAGLDARPWRMTELPKSLRWVDVDLQGILDHKLELMAGETPLYQPAPDWIVAATLPDPSKAGASSPPVQIFDSQLRIEKGVLWTYRDSATRVATTSVSHDGA